MPEPSATRSYTQLPKSLSDKLEVESRRASNNGEADIEKSANPHIHREDSIVSRIAEAVKAIPGSQRYADAKLAVKKFLKIFPVRYFALKACPTQDMFCRAKKRWAT